MTAQHRLTRVACDVLMELWALDAAMRPAPAPNTLKYKLGHGGDGYAKDAVSSAIGELSRFQLITLRPRNNGRENTIQLLDAGRAAGRALIHAAGNNAPRYGRVKIRRCMTCGAPFQSDGPHHRLCERHRKGSLHRYSDGYSVGRRAGLA